MKVNHNSSVAKFAGEFVSEMMVPEVSDPVSLEVLVMIFYVRQSLQHLALLVLFPRIKVVDHPW